MKLFCQYVDPGEGFVFVQNASFLWWVLLGILGTGIFFFKAVFKFFKKTWLIIIIVCTIVLAGLFAFFLTHRSANKQKVFILGIDGMDPVITERLMAEGRLPNFRRLKERGAYARLKTIQPPQSLVVWTSFFTGLNPGGHGIFDFVKFDRATHKISLNFNTAYKKPRNISIGGIKIPLGSTTETVCFYKGDPFWTVLSRHHILAYVYFCPNTFPAQPLSGGMLSGMGVPDVSGMMDRYTFYTGGDIPGQKEDYSRGRIIHLDKNSTVFHTGIYGPKISRNNAISETVAGLQITVFPRDSRVALDFQGQHVVLAEKEWSPWKKVQFNLGPADTMKGIVRFYLKSIKPELGLYMTPVNFDPLCPYLPISYPADYSKKVAVKTGLYSTLGSPHDMWALREGGFDEKAFLQSADELLRERGRILQDGLKRFKGGVFFFYVDTLDAVQHLFWRYIDDQHPLFEESPLYKDAIYGFYEKIDRMLGEVQKELDKDTMVIVVSDHGFTSFRRKFNLNRWLLEHGFLYVHPGFSNADAAFKDIDWEKTRAYAMGFGGIYLNRWPSEDTGESGQSVTDRLKQEIRSGLLRVTDPVNGRPVVRDVYFREDIFKGLCMDDAPDLFVGFNPGYRICWQNVLGDTPAFFLEDNTNKWSGDHIGDAAVVPGILFTSKPIEHKDPSILDIVPSVYAVFGIPAENNQPGKALFGNDGN